MRRAPLLAFLSLLLAACASTELQPVSQATDFKPEDDEQRLWLRASEEAAALNGSGLIYEDGELEAYLNQVAQKIQPAEVRARIPFKIRVIKNPFLNAFAFPHGPIYVHTGILARMDNEAQFATLLAHEMTHATHRHTAKEFRHIKNKSAALATFQATFGGTPVVGSLFSTLGEIGTMASVTGYSSELEREADTEGLRLIARAGYDVHEAPKIFEQFKQELEAEKVSEPFFFGTHPRVKERMANYQRMLQHDYQGRVGGSTNADVFQGKIGRLLLENAWLDLRTGRYALAEKAAERYLKTRRGDARGYYLLGEIHRQRGEAGDLDKARPQYQKAITLDPNYPDPYRAMGLLQLKRGDKASAKKHLSRYLLLAPRASDRSYVDEYLKDCN